MPDVIKYERGGRTLSMPADKVTTLNERYRNTLRSAVINAMENYGQLAKEARESFEQMKGKPVGEGQMVTPVGMQRIAEQFEQQVKDCQTVLDLIDGDEDAEFDTEILFVAEARN
jgi:hypothetical protein